MKCAQCSTTPSFWTTQAGEHLCFNCAELFRQNQRKSYGIGLPARKVWTPGTFMDGLTIGLFIGCWLVILLLSIEELAR